MATNGVAIRFFNFENNIVFFIAKLFILDGILQDLHRKRFGIESVKGFFKSRHAVGKMISRNTLKFCINSGFIQKLNNFSSGQ